VTETVREFASTGASFSCRHLRRQPIAVAQLVSQILAASLHPVAGDLREPLNPAGLGVCACPPLPRPPARTAPS